MRKLTRGQRRQVVINLFRNTIWNKAIEISKIEDFDVLKDRRNRSWELQMEKLHEINHELMDFSYKEISDEHFCLLLERYGLGDLSMKEYYDLWQEGYVPELEDVWPEKVLEDQEEIENK